MCEVLLRVIWQDIDYFQQKLTADISTSTALLISISTSANYSGGGNALLHFYFNGSSEALSFTNLGAGGTLSQFDFSLNPGQRDQSWLVSPLRWGSSTDFLATAQRADVKVEGYAYDISETALLGDAVNYSIRVDRVLLGTPVADIIVGDGLAGYIDARGGNDRVSGSANAEQIVGGTGDDTLLGGGGDDTLVAGTGTDSLDGGLGNDTLNIQGKTATPVDMLDGGDGTDTLKISSNAALGGLTIRNLEILEGDGGTLPSTPQAVLDLGFTTVNNLTFLLDPSLSAGGTLDGSSLSGNFNLCGTTQSDRLIGNDKANTIYLASDLLTGTGLGADTVTAGGGDDTIEATQGNYFVSWQAQFSSVDIGTKTYSTRGSIDGGAGNDALKFSRTVVYHPWGGNSGDATAWNLDLSQLTLANVERLEFANYRPTELNLNASQVFALTSITGVSQLALFGGGSVDLAKVQSLGITSWRIGDAGAYTITGTAAGDIITVGAGATNVLAGDGNDTIVINSKANVIDVLDGGAGNDVLRITGSDVDLSGATLSNIESIVVSSASLSLTTAQWSSIANVTRAAGTNTAYILSVPTAGDTTLAADSEYVGLTGSSGDDHLIGNAGNNILVGGAGSDEIVGNAGNDRLVSGAGLDSLYGGDGNDTLVVTGKSTSRDLYHGGAGADTLQITGSVDLTAATITAIESLDGNGTVTLSATQMAGFAEVRGITVQLSGTSNNFVLGATQIGTGATVLLPSPDPTLSALPGVLGTAMDDVITGGSFGDVIYGGRGADRLDGGAGNDTLIGGSGVDTLMGGAGDDLFQYQASEFAAVAGTAYSDVIDGGAGADTLELNFNGTDGKMFSMAQGAVSGVEVLRVNSPNWNVLSLDAPTFRQLSVIDVSAQTVDYRHSWLNLLIAGDGGDIRFDAVLAQSKFNSVHLTGLIGAIDARQLNVGPLGGDTADGYNYVDVGNFDSIVLGDIDNRLYVQGDSQFTATLGAGNDSIRVSGVRDLRASIDGGSGTDTLDLAQNSLIDISNSTLTSVENIQHGAAAVVVSQTQMDTLSFEGTGPQIRSRRQSDQRLNGRRQLLG